MNTYRQTYTYDASTNLLALRHTQNGTTQARTQPMRARNNRQRFYTYDEAGNQLSTDTLDQLCYGADGQIGRIEWQQGGYKMREDYTYLQPGVRARYPYLECGGGVDSPGNSGVYWSGRKTGELPRREPTL
ncbi:hypothetical protein [uncultured Microscilla sp.]|uniref:hypothetical protein n=1 Tax=uncultured Microscilla sp. TaxID=432653 RepID=UPI00260910D4|nr:hypothetical protein [uncultured Microscilla sp.]